MSGADYERCTIATSAYDPKRVLRGLRVGFDGGQCALRGVRDQRDDTVWESARGAQISELVAEWENVL